MNIGRLRLVVGVLALGALAASWLVAEYGGVGVGVAVQTAALIGVFLLVAGIQHRENRRLAIKIDTLRQKVQGQLDGSSGQHDRLANQLGLVSEQVKETSQQLARVAQQLEEEREAAERSRATGVPQEHFEQLTRLLAANNERLESAVDDLARRMQRADGTTDGSPARSQP